MYRALQALGRREVMLGAVWDGMSLWLKPSVTSPCRWWRAQLKPFERISGTGVGDTTTHVDVVRHGRFRVTELIGCRPGRKPSLVHQGGDGFAEYVGSDPLEARSGESIT